jgi:cell division protein FtsN
MATKRNTTRRSKPNEGGSTLYGALAGLLIGLIVAAAIAFYVTKAPIPFVDRAIREPDQGRPLDPRNVPDPNLGLYGAAGSAPTGLTATAPIPLSGSTQSPPAPVPDRMDSLGALIATLPPSPSPAPSQPAPATVPQAKTPPAPQAATPAAAARRDPAPAPAPATGTYYLQAGAYTAAVDAESLKARIIMMGLPVAVQQAEVNGMQINRVRVGPFSRLDDMNRARSRLGKNKIESAIVRQ